MSATMKQVEVKERPIIFSGPMVKAILGGRKTQTRRVVTNERVKVFAPGYADDRERIAGLCPYGRAGDRLWVREALRWTDFLVYDADHEPVDPDRIPAGIRIGRDYLPMTHMPRWASRITLEITNVRAERLQDITEADAVAEGFNPAVCERVFTTAAGKVKQSNCYWLEHEETSEEDSGENGNYCLECARARQKKVGKKWRLCGDGGSAMESDGPAYCECGTPLLMSLTEYGIERELRIEDDPEGQEPRYFPVSGVDASIAAMFAGGIGDLQEKHHGRLAQTGFATRWNLLNAKCGYSWESNPLVWVIEFKKL